MALARRPQHLLTVTTPIVTVVIAGSASWAIGTLAELDPSEHGTTPGPIAWWITIAVLVAQGVVLAFLRRAPRAVMCVVAALPLAIAVFSPSALFTASAIPVLVAAFMASLRKPFSRVVLSAVLAAALIAAGQFLNGAGLSRSDFFEVVFGAVGQAVVVVGLPMLLASVVAANRAVRQAKEEAINALVRERDAQVGEAIALERTAMARELHDIAAHHLSGISLMASAVARQVTTNPDAARAGALQVRAQSNAVLDDLRSLVGLLREAETREGKGATDGMVKTLATIRELVRTAQLSGARITLEVQTRDSVALGFGIPPLAQLTAYRMVQESLTNSAKYAPGSTTTILIEDEGMSELLLTVKNSPGDDPSPPGRSEGGFGLVGMRERATLIGGFFDSGPTAEGGWRNTMRIPRDIARLKKDDHH